MKAQRPAYAEGTPPDRMWDWEVEIPESLAIENPGDLHRRLDSWLARRGHRKGQGRAEVSVGRSMIRINSDTDPTDALEGLISGKLTEEEEVKVNRRTVKGIIRNRLYQFLERIDDASAGRAAQPTPAEVRSVLGDVVRFVLDEDEAAIEPGG